MIETPSEAKRLNASQRAAGSSPQANMEEAGIHRQYQQQKDAAHEEQTQSLLLEDSIYLLFMCVTERERRCRHTHAAAHGWKSKDNLQELVLDSSSVALGTKS